MARRDDRVRKNLAANPASCSAFILSHKRLNLWVRKPSVTPMTKTDENIDRNQLDLPPSQTGTAGPRFEVQVATHYGLCLLARSEPRGLPGVEIYRIAFQRGAMRHPLDDVIIFGQDVSGREWVLDIQVKRTIAFRASDAAFQSVMKQIAETLKIEDESSIREFAVATQFTNHKIEHGVQEALEWARTASDADDFFARLNSPGRANAAMLGFVKTITAALAEHEVVLDEPALFDLLKRFKVMVFDYGREGSSWDYFDADRAGRLFTTERDDLPSPYGSIYEILDRIDAAGGATTRTHLLDKLSERGWSVSPSQSFARGRARLAAHSQSALRRINRSTAGLHLERTALRGSIEAELDAPIGTSRVIVTLGDGGVGKSALLRTVAEARSSQAAVMVLAPGGSIKGGWEGVRHSLEIDATAEEFLSDLAADGSRVVCIDGIDRFTDPDEQATVSDIILAAVATKGLKLLVTARPGWDGDGLTWLSDDVLDAMGDYHSVEVGLLSDEEAEAFSGAVPSAYDLLRPDHPAKNLVRNFFRLRRLLGRKPEDLVFHTEAELALDWWETGDGVQRDTEGARRDRRKVLKRLVDAWLAGEREADVSGVDSAHLEALKAAGSIQFDDLDQARFGHDVLVDWGVGCFLAATPAGFDSFDLTKPVPLAIARGVEMASRIIVENAEQQDDWRALIEKMSASGVHRSWRRQVLMALVRSEHSAGLLVRWKPLLLENDGELAAELLKRTLVYESQTLKTYLAALGLPEVPVPDGYYAPVGRAWLSLVYWSVENLEDLPTPAASAAIRLFENWMLAHFGADQVSRRILERCVEAAEVERREEARPVFERFQDQKNGINHLLFSRESLSNLKQLIGLYALKVPDLAKTYLDGAAQSENLSFQMNEIVRQSGHLPSAAPKSFANLIRAAVEDVKTSFEEDTYFRSRPRHLLSMFEMGFIEAQPGAGPFLAILTADPDTGIDLVRYLVEESIKWDAKQEGDEPDAFTFELGGEERRFYASWSYFWPRGRSRSPILSSALMALEYWAQETIAAGADITATINTVLGQGDCAAAFLAVAVDLVLSNSGARVETICDLLASPELVSLDSERAKYDFADRVQGQADWPMDVWRGDAMPPAEVQKAQKKRLAEAGSREKSLNLLYGYLARDIAKEPLDRLREKLKAAQDRLGVWGKDEVVWEDPVFVASHALWALKPENYRPATYTKANGETEEGRELVMPEGQAAWLLEKDAKGAEEFSTFFDGLAVRNSADTQNLPEDGLLDRAVRIMEATAEATPPQPHEDRSKPTDPWLARLGACALIAKSAPDGLFETWRVQIEEAFGQAIAQPHDLNYTMSGQIRYDAQALAITALIYTLKRTNDEEQLELLLKSVAEHGESAALACRTHKAALIETNADLPKAVARIGVETAFAPYRKTYDEAEDDAAKRKADYEARVSNRAKQEYEWLAYSGEEPKWPEIPGEHLEYARKQEHVRSQLATFFDHRRAAKWSDFLDDGTKSEDASYERWIDHHLDWTAIGNRAQEERSDWDEYESEWTDSLYRLAAARAFSWTAEQRQRMVFDRLKTLSDKAFVSAAAKFLVQSDLEHIMGGPEETAWLAKCRSSIWDQLRERGIWKSHEWSNSFGIDHRLVELTSAIYCKANWGVTQRSYLGGLVPDQILPFVETQKQLCLSANKCHICAVHLIDVLEKLPTQTIQQPLLEVLGAWVEGRSANMKFWEKGRLGARVCALISVAQLSPTKVPELMNVLDTLSSAGVGSAAILETKLQSLANHT